MARLRRDPSKRISDQVLLDKAFVVDDQHGYAKVPVLTHPDGILQQPLTAAVTPAKDTNCHHIAEVESKSQPQPPADRLSLTSSKRTDAKTKAGKRIKSDGRRAGKENTALSHIHRTFADLRLDSNSNVSMKPAAVSSSVGMRSVRFLVASLGNPAPYQETRHSAGHLVLKSIQSHLSLPGFTKSKTHGGLVSSGADVGNPAWTLFQSPSYMNTSGISVLKAYREFCGAQKNSSSDSINGLVILHDEMELAPSAVKLRRGLTSAKGHNGVKSVQTSLQSAGMQDLLGSDHFIKLAIGIGRPAGKTRAPDEISDYVLAQLTAEEKHGLHLSAAKVVALLEDEMLRLASSSSSSSL